MVFQHTQGNEPRGWNDLVENSPSALVYHSAPILQLYAETFRNTLHYFTKENEHGEIISGHIFLEKKIRVPIIGERAQVWYSYAPPLTNEENQKLNSKNEIVDFASNIAFRHGAFSTSFWSSPHDDNSSAEFPSFTKELLENAVIKLSSTPESFFTGLDKSLRKNIRTTQTNGLIVREGRAEDVKEYYRHYSAHHHQRGLDTYPQSFFEKLVSIFETEKMGKFWIAEKDNEFAAGLMVSIVQKRMYEMAVSSSSVHLPLFPNDALKWHAVKYGFENNYSVFDLSNIDPQTRSNSPTAGINRYKLKWGVKVSYPKYKKMNMVRGILGTLK